MLERLGDEARAVVSYAEEEAQRLVHDHVGTEHILLGLLGTSGPAAEVLRAAGATLDGCRSKVEELVGPPRGRSGDGVPGFTERAQRALMRADRLSVRRRHAQVQPQHILASLLDVEGTAGQVLRGASVDVADLRVTVSEMLDRSVRRAQAGDRTQRAEPRCGACGERLGDGPLFRVVDSEDEGGSRHPVVVIYCRSCGSVLGAGLTTG